MERSFFVNKESRYSKDLDVYMQRVKNQQSFVKKFFDENNIEAENFYINGAGICNLPFSECRKKDIRLYIIPSEKDLQIHGKQLLKPDNQGLHKFRSNSKILKLFAEQCIDNEIIINIYAPDIRYYFKSMDCLSCSYQRFLWGGGYFIKVKNACLDQDDIPDGFTPIKLSEFYVNLDQYEESKIN